MKRKRNLQLCFLAALFASGSFPRADAQVGGGIGFGQLDLFRQITATAAAMRRYRCEHSHFPQQTPELDAALMAVFGAVSMSPAPQNVSVQSQNNFRTYFQFAIALDPSIRGLSVVNGRVNIPNNWQADPNTIVIMTDGADTMAIWAASGDRKPINDPTTNNPLVILQTVDCGARPQN